MVARASVIEHRALSICYLLLAAVQTSGKRSVPEAFEGWNLKFPWMVDVECFLPLRFPA